MADNTQEQQVSPIQSGMETVKHLAPPPPKKMKTAADWVRDLRMNADVNKTTVGVETDRVTPDLMLATSSKLLGISRRQIEPDPKDSLEFQRIYGPAEYFSEHILRDAGRLGRQLLWKATNRGNLDFMSTGALDQHVSDVFNSSKLANMIDGSSPLETVDASFKVTRIGEGGVGDISSAPDEMRLVQPSFLGYIDSVRSPECATQRHEVLTINGWKPIADVTTGDSVACMVNGKLEWHKPERVVVYPYEGPIYAYDDGHLAYELTPDHRAWCDTGHGYTFQQASDLHGTEAAFQTLGPDGAYDKPGSIQLLPLFYKKFFYQGNVYCLTVPGGMFYTRIRNYSAFWTGNSLKVGLDAYMTKHCMKGSDGKLYQEFINARTGKKELVDSVTAAKSVVTTPDMMKAKTNHIYAVGGKTGVRIVKKSDVDYYLPNMDEAFSAAANLVTNMSGVKEMRLLMGCLHPMTTIVTVGKKNDVDIIYAKDASTACNAVPGIDAGHMAKDYKIRTTVAKFPRNRAWFRKIVLCSGRVLITSKDHRWPVWRDGRLVLVDAEKLKPDDQVLRTTFKGLPSRRTFVNDTQVTPDVAELLGFISRSGRMVENRLRIAYGKAHREALETAVARLGLKDVKFYVNGADDCLGVSDKWFVDWVANNMGFGQEARIPSAILGARPNISIHFLDAYTADQTLVAEDALEYTWILDIPSVRQRDGLALLWARMGTDTYYRDAYQGDGRTVLALKLTEFINPVGDCVVDIVKANLPSPSAPIMIDIDIDDNMYATANGVVTHNSKYPLQAVSIEGREPPLVRNLDMRSGSDIHSKIGRYLGARYANKPGIVTAVRQHAIDVQYDDGTKGRVAMYDNFPMNAKGFLTNTPQVKAGDRFKKGDLLASSNYTDDKGTMATGTNLRVGWLSWHGGTYEDAVVLSESAAKKLTSTTMYSTDLDLDKTVALGKKNYQAWKPDEFTAEQLSILDDEGIVKPGTILQKGDPMVLAVRTTEPSPGTMGKRILTDISETWEHDHPGKVTDIVRTRNGVRVLATVTAPAEVGDKVSGCFDAETEIFTKRGFVRFDRLMRDDEVAVMLDDGTASWETPYDYIHYKFDGQMYAHKDRFLDFMVTPDHNMLYVTKYYYEEAGCRKAVLSTANDIACRAIYIPCAAEFPEWRDIIHEVEIPLVAGDRAADKKTDFDVVDFASLLGIYLAEGHCDKRLHVVHITKSKEHQPAVYAEVAELLNRMGLKWRYDENRRFTIVNANLCAYMAKLGHAEDKYIPEEVFTSWPRAAWDALIAWHYKGDGDKTGITKRIASASPQLIRGLQRLHILLGHSCTWTDIDSAMDGKLAGTRDLPRNYRRYRLTEQPDKWHQINKTRKMQKTEYHGYVYCVSTQAGRILVMRKGKIMWCGNCHGNKGVASKILPDDQMPKDKDGKPLDILLSPLGLVSRTNPAQLNETLLGKIAHKTGKPEFMNPFYEGDIHEDILAKLKQNGLTADDDFFDPETGRKIPGVVNGYSYFHKLKHLSESKESARGTDEYACYSADTEVLTDRGWIAWPDVTEGMRLYTYDHVTHTAWFEKPSSLYKYEYNGQLVALAGQHCDMLVTPNHNMFIAKYSKNPEAKHKFFKAQACDVAKLNRFRMLRAGAPVADEAGYGLAMLTIPGVDYTKNRIRHVYGAESFDCEAFAALLGWILSDGSITQEGKDHSNRVTIYQKADRRAELDSIEQCLRACGKAVTFTDNKEGIRRYVFNDPVLVRWLRKECGCSSVTWRIPEFVFASSATRNAFYGTYMLGDGSSSTGNNVITTVSPQMAEDLTRLLALMGSSSSKTVVTRVRQIREDSAWKYPFNYPIYTVLEHNSPAISFNLKDPRYKLNDIRFVNYSGPVYCATVSTGLLLVRRNGKMCICGNSDETPGGSGYTGAKRYGTLEIGAMVGYNAFDNLLDNKLIRGQQNSEFWRSIRTGGIPTIPGEPLVQKKFFAHLQGSGVNVRKTPKGISVFALSNSDVNELAGPREVKTRDTYEARTFRPIDGGLFGQDVFGQNGDRWGYIQLDEPVPNPVMEEPLARLLRMTDKDFNKVVTGTGEVNGIRGTVQLRDVLSKINLDQEAKQAMQEFKEAPASKKDAALKRYTAVEEMRRAGLNPAEYMLDRIPVLPAQFRPVSSHNGLTMVADANYLYAQLLDARDDMRDAKDLPQEYQDKARENLYRTWQELVGLYDPEDIKLRNKNVGGLLKWALGTSPKFSAFHRKVLGGAVDTVGRGVIVPNARLTIDQVGIPISMAFGIMAPFVERGLVKRGYTPVDAMKMVKNQDKRALDVLQEVVKTHPVEINRAPTLHRFNIQAQEPVLVQGHSIQVHPSICPALAGDFDGDQINIHVPVSDNARREAMEKMRPSRNLIAPSDRKILFKPEKEYMQGLYIATRLGKETGRPVIFRTVQEAKEAYRSGAIDIDTPIRIMEQK